MAGLRDLAIRILISGEDQTGPAIRSVNAGTDSIKKGFENLETAARRILGITLFVGLAKEAIDLSYSYKGLQGRLKQVTDSSLELEQVNKRLFAIAQAAQMPLADTVTLYARTALALDKLNNGQELAAKLTETVALSFKAQNSSTSEMTSTVLQLTQSLATGNVTWEDFGNVAQSNLLLANIAAKNLGYDGIASLKAAIGKAQVSGVQLTEALVAGFEEVKAKADAMGLTVKGSWAQINNALLVFIGQSKEANSASTFLANGLHIVSENFDALVSGVITLAEIYAARLVVGLITSTKAFFDNAAAVKVAAIAQEQARAQAIAYLEVKAREAAANVLIKQQLVLEAAQRRALATSITAETAALAKMTAARNAYNVAVTRAAAANTRLAATQEVVATSSGILSRALGVLGTSTSALFGAWIAFDIGYTFGEWLRQFEAVRIAGTYLAEGFVMIQTGAQAMLNGMSFSERWAQIKQIHEEFNTLRAAETVSNQASVTATGISETQKTEVIKAAAAQQQQAFATTQAAVKALTATIDAETKTQTAAIQQGLANRIAAIAAADLSDTAKETQRVAAKIAAIKQTMALDQNAATQKLALIDQEYATELQSAQANATRLAGIETSKREAKLSVYRGIAEFYAGEVAKLSTLYGEETAAFAQSRDALQSLASANSRNLLDIERQSMTEHEQLESKQDAFDKDLSDIKKERKKGDAADQNKINMLVADAKTYVSDLTKVTVDGAISEYKAKDNVNALYAVEKQALTDSAAAHEKNAAAIKAALDVAATELAKANAQITEMTTALNQTYLLKVGIDQGSFDAAQAAIAELTKPETKVITIVTENVSSGGGEGGGYAGGGWLPGFGGGDKIAAFLEAGEFVVRKEAVKALGTPVLQNYINYGKLPAGDAIYRAMGGPVKRLASGGLVGGDEIQAVVQKKKNEQDALAVASLLNNVTYYAYLNSFTGSTRNALDQMINALHLWGMDYLGDYVAEGMTYVDDPDKFNAVKNLIIEKIRSGNTTAAGAMPSVDLQQLAGGAAAASKSAAVAAPARKMVNIQFTAPGAEPVAGQYLEMDLEKLLQTLKSAGLRSNVV